VAFWGCGKAQNDNVKLCGCKAINDLHILKFKSLIMLDLLIIGGSAAATTAGIYGIRRGLNLKIIAKDFGGEVATSGEIGNWPGDGMTDGISLSGKFKKHLEYYKVDLEEGIEVEIISKQDDGSFCVATKKGGSMAIVSEKVPILQSSERAKKCDYIAKAVIVATGVRPRGLNIPGEKEFRNKGVSYCSTCDMPLFTGKTVAIIGGGNSALESGLMALDIAKKAYIINKNPVFKGDDILIKKLTAAPKDKVEIIYEAGTSEIMGDKFVTSLKYKDKAGNGQKLKIDGVFIHIGMVPNSHIVPENVEKNQFGEVKVNGRCETNIPGLYAAGDITDVPFKQIVIAAGQGCLAALSAVQYLNSLSNKKV